METVNEAVSRFFRDEPPELALHDLHMAIGAADVTTLALTGVGNLRAFFFREDQPNTFHVFDLLRAQREESPNAEKIFGSLVSGEIKPSDTLAITDTQTIDLVGDAKLKREAGTKPPKDTALLVRKQLELRDCSGVAIFIKFEKQPTSVVEPAKKSSHASVIALRKTEALTERLMKGLPRFSIRPWISRLHPPHLPNPKRLADFLHDASLVIFDFFKRSATALWHLAHSKNIRRAVGGGTGNLIERFNRLPPRAKLLALAAIVFVVLMLQSIIFLNYQQSARLTRTNYEKSTSEVERLIDEAGASLIYKDEEQANKLLNQALVLAQDLPSDSRTRKSIKTKLISKTKDAIKELRHEISVTPEVVTTPLPSPRVAIEDGAIVLFDEQGVKTTLALAFPQGPPADAEIFGTKLYILVPGAHQIYRLNKRGQTFSGLAPWLRDEAPELKDARALTLDGAIYVLRPNEVIKFFTGLREDWQPYIDPPLEDARRIWTDDETRGIYILERQRIVVLSKQGNLLAQYIFREDGQIMDFAVDEVSQKLTLQRSDTIEQINLIHLTPK